MTRKIILMLVSISIFSGCGYVLVRVDEDRNASIPLVVTEENLDNRSKPRYYYTTQSPSPVVLTHADIKNKKVYIERAKETLMQFRVIARDLSNQEEEQYVKEIGREANSYVKSYVEPIINDPDAVGHLETRAEIAKLHLLSASLYYELAGYFQAKFYLERLSGQYENDFLSSITIDQLHMGYSTVFEGIQDLQKKIALKQMAATGSM